VVGNGRTRVSPAASLPLTRGTPGEIKASVAASRAAVELLRKMRQRKQDGPQP
jgi:hypothetical protein